MAKKPKTPKKRALVEALESLIDPDRCSFDHNGNCQAHLSFGDEPGQCAHADAKALVKDYYLAKGEPLEG